MFNSTNQTSQISNYSSQAVNQQAVSAFTEANTENKLVSQFLTVGNSNIDLHEIEKKENDLFDAVKKTRALLTVSNTLEPPEQTKRFYQAGLAIGIAHDFQPLDPISEIAVAKMKAEHIYNNLPIKNQLDESELVIENRGKAFVASFLSASTVLDSTVYAQALNIGSDVINEKPTDNRMVNHFLTMWNLRDTLAVPAPDMKTTN
ncbi:hypothetical protein QE177_02510 [Arsenophonus sp. aPb]|uniref:hypothetical protein n=1 Tax=Arsenophonus sp. aPb TaxID=3041619 RepID=UPI002468B22C|nr:hypothetical protein [Arsenophonus sp. aPb]WGL98801.1 hypothetical protein QE177_02510 [Arsenophonus sp. aPb]